MEPALILYEGLLQSTVASLPKTHNILKYKQESETGPDGVCPDIPCTQMKKASIKKGQGYVFAQIQNVLMT